MDKLSLIVDGVILNRILAGMKKIEKNGLVYIRKREYKSYEKNHRIL